MMSSNIDGNLWLQYSLLLKWNRINLQHHFLGSSTESHKKHPEVIWEHRNTYTYVYNQAHAHKGDLVSVLPPKNMLWGIGDISCYAQVIDSVHADGLQDPQTHTRAVHVARSWCDWWR